MPKDLANATVLVVGAGVMGTGIAQVAAQSGHEVMLFDTRESAAANAIGELSVTMDRLVERGKILREKADEALNRMTPIDSLADAATARIVIEAVVEDLEVKRNLFACLEDIVPEDAVLATNTSSISVTAIAAGLTHPARVAGMHFFNPVPLMNLVEVVSGLQTDPDVAALVYQLAERWGKKAVHAASTPGFIVNRIARPFYAESLELLQQRVTDHATIDACIRGAGFRMGPCELMDLIGHDTNFAVTESVYRANFMDKRFKPSLMQKALVDGGLLGRKSGRGFYQYGEGSGTKPDTASVHHFPQPPDGQVVLHGDGFVKDLLVDRLRGLGLSFEQVVASSWTGIETSSGQLRLTDGYPASALGENVAVFDLPISGLENVPIAMAVSARATADWRAQSAGWLAALGFIPRDIDDSPGLVVARTIAMLINEAADAVHQGVCTEEGADDAMQMGVNYPCGPFQWLSKWGVAPVVELLDRLDAYYRGERYRVSPLLRHRTWA